MIDPANRVVLVSGANRGIGLAIAQCLNAKGYRLSLGLRDDAALPETLRRIDADRLHIARYVAADWTTHDAWVAAATERFWRIDALVNNAGADSPMKLRNASEAELDRIWAVNCKAPLHMIALALPHLEASGAGRILNVSSLSGKRVANDNVAYAMSKFAVMALTHAARRISLDKGVRATAICPGFVRTDMTAGAKFPREEMIDPADLAELVATVIALPNTASIAELLVSCRLEPML